MKAEIVSAKILEVNYGTPSIVMNALYQCEDRPQVTPLDLYSWFRYNC